METQETTGDLVFVIHYRLYIELQYLAIIPETYLIHTVY